VSREAGPKASAQTAPRPPKDRRPARRRTRAGTAGESGWFIYYRVPEAELATVAAAVRGFQARLQADWPGLRAEWLRRPELVGGQLTLMEVYRWAGIGTAAAAGLAAAIEDAAGVLAPHLASERHREQFLPCA